MLQGEGQGLGRSQGKLTGEGNREKGKPPPAAHNAAMAITGPRSGPGHVLGKVLGLNNKLKQGGQNHTWGGGRHGHGAG